MTWLNGYGGSNNQIPGITKVRTLYARGQSKNLVVPRLFTTILQRQNQAL